MIIETDLGEQIFCDDIVIWLNGVPYKAFEKDGMLRIEKYAKQESWFSKIVGVPLETLDL